MTVVHGARGRRVGLRECSFCSTDSGEGWGRELLEIENAWPLPGKRRGSRAPRHPILWGRGNHAHI